MAKQGTTDRRAFTLVELLVVLAIIGAILLITLNNFSGIGRGASMQSAISQLRTTLSLARQWAITKHETTYVIFPGDDNSLYSGAYVGHVTKAFRAYNVYTTSKGYIRDWTYLPQGILFAPDEGNFQTDFGAGVTNTKIIYNFRQNTNQVSFPLGFPDTNRIHVVRALRFEPDGRTYQNCQPEFFMSEGLCNVDTNLGRVDGVEFRPVGQRIMFSIDVFGQTGQFRVRDYNKK